LLSLLIELGTSILPNDKGLTSSMPMMMDLGLRKEDAGESTNRSAKFMQPTIVLLPRANRRDYNMWN
jgi:hypothetical protein